MRLARGSAAVAAVSASAAFALRFGADLDALAAAAFFAVLATLSVIDLEQRRLPNVIVLPAAAAAFAAVAALHPALLGEAGVAGLGAFLFFFVPALLMPRAVGMGDAKLALLIGPLLGADVVAALLAAAVAVGLAAALLLAARGRAARNTVIPFGPFLSAGAALALVAGGGTLYA